MHGVLAVAALVAAPLAAQSSGFPTRPLSAGPTALGDGGSSPTALDAVFLNPARVAGRSGLAATYLIQEETGLRGSSLAIGFRAGLPVAVTVWKYDVGDLFDDALLAADPSLEALGVYTTGADLAVGMPKGAWALGVGVSGEFSHTLGRNRQRFASRAGAFYDGATLTAGLSWTNGMERNPLVGLRTGMARATISWRPSLGPTTLELGHGGAWLVAEGRLDFVSSVMIGPKPLQILAGWRWGNRQFTGGLLMRLSLASVAVAREFGGRDALGGLTVLTAALGW